MTVTYEQMTHTERAEAHVLSARHFLGGASESLKALAGPLAGPPQQTAMLLAAAQAQFAGAQAEALLAQACAMLAANEGETAGKTEARLTVFPMREDRTDA